MTRQHWGDPVFLFFTACLSWILTGCTTMGVQSTFSYTDPAETAVDNSILLVREPSEVWDELVEDLATTFYVINNIDKESRLLNVSFSETIRPSVYVDCGSSIRTYEYKGDLTKYEYLTSDSSFYYYNTGFQIERVFYAVTRSTSLDGRANIYVAPNSAGGTIVTVNSRYIWQASNTATPMSRGRTGMAPLGALPDIITPPISIALSTRQPGFYNAPDGSETIHCVATGAFENSILDILR